MWYITQHKLHFEKLRAVLKLKKVAFAVPVSENRKKLKGDRVGVHESAGKI